MNEDKSTIGGSTGWSSEANRKAEERLEEYLTKKWGPKGISVQLFRGRFCPLDGHIFKDDHVAAVIEFKSRPTLKAETVFISIRKYLRLVHNALALECRGLYFMELPEGYFFIDVEDIDIKRQRRHACKGAWHSPNDLEPIIEFDKEEMTKV